MKSGNNFDTLLLIKNIAIYPIAGLMGRIDGAAAAKGTGDDPSDDLCFPSKFPPRTNIVRHVIGVSDYRWKIFIAGTHGG